MKFRSVVIQAILIGGLTPAVFAQTPFYPLPPTPTPTPPAPSQTPKLSEILAINLAAAQRGPDAPRERREQAYAKLLEGQRYIITSGRTRSSTVSSNSVRMARQSLQKAVELDPRLAEGYTALAELANDVDEAIDLAGLATSLQPDNFGGHRLTARLYTLKSRVSTGSVDKNFAEKAIGAWKEVARVDPRNAEAWAFLSVFYDKNSASDLSISAMKKWLSSAPPVETRFYKSVMGREEELSPETASLKLGPALMKAGRTREAVEVLSLVVADDPENIEAVELLRDAIESVDGPGASTAIESLQQAVYANPDNVALITLLAQANARAGKFDDAVKVLQAAAVRVAEKDKVTASFMHLSLGELFIKENRVNEGISAYQGALDARGITSTELATDDDREFAISVFMKMIRAYKDANRQADVRAVIERARLVLGKDDLFADRELISFFREQGKKAEALQAVRVVRTRMPDDYPFMRLEATLLTENGRVDEGVALIRKLIDNKPLKAVVGTSGNETPTIESLSPMYDDFSNYIFISSLFSGANRGKDAVAAANSAFNATTNPTRKEMAKLTLATAQQMSGDFAGAEATLREILKKTPGNPIALNNLGYFLLEQDKSVNEAFELIKKALEVEPTNPSYLDSLGWTYYKLGNYAEAEKKLLEAARFDSSSSTIQEHIGDVYLKQGKAPQAKTAWEKALVLTSDPADITRLKGKLGRK